MCPEEAILCRVPGLIGIADNQVGGPEGDLLVLAHELLEGRRIATSSPFDPFAIEQWTALHLCHPYTAGAVPVPSCRKTKRPGDVSPGLVSLKLVSAGC